MPGTRPITAKQAPIIDEAGELEPAVADPVHPPDGQDVAGHRGDGEDRQLDGDRRGLRGVRRDEGDDLRGGDRVAVVGVVEQEPAARRPGQQDQEPAAGQERPQAGGLARRVPGRRRRCLAARLLAASAW